jgi:RNA polymerase sigma-70 factor (ECF subfamily)
MDDGRAIRRLKRGDMAGLETLISRYQVKAVRTAYLVTHDEAVAEDVVQEAFVHIYQKIHRFDESRPFEAYLMRSVINGALNAVRRQHRSVPLDGNEAEVEALLAKARSVESQVEYTQLQQNLLVALSRLSPRQRTVVVQRYYLEMSEREMAQALAVAPGTVKWLLHAARARLRQLLGSTRRAE